MDGLRPRKNNLINGFTTAEIEKMEKSLNETGDKCLNVEFFKKLARSFNSASGRAGKPKLKWSEVQSWYQNRQLESASKDKKPDTSTLNEPDVTTLTSKDAGDSEHDYSKLKFEARSSKDGAWYDVEKFVTYRNSRSKQTEARVRFVGYGPEDDEWLNVKESIRECSLGIDHSECQILKPGVHVVCFQEKNDFAKYYDAHIVDIKRKMHDARGCRCDFRIRYNHDNVEETVDLNRLYRRPEFERPHQRDA
ncbi:SAWADEE domain-containing protein [Heracleum sosnowskyi]|uniref:SAWADEE domain-containing protein n=1 Tax=Heracleum sosnowskyi TaxID=360622 RepID=A0AAD8HMX6_9APIA|nr:SAWADEE domain-containing protein [Heracleum sosnowskyi]